MVHHKYYQWVVFVLFLQVVEQKIYIMINKINLNKRYDICVKNILAFRRFAFTSNKDFSKLKPPRTRLPASTCPG